MSVTPADYASTELSKEQAEELVKKNHVDLAEVVGEHLFDGRLFMRRNAALVSRVSGKVPAELVKLLAVGTKDNDPIVREHATLALAKVEAPLELVAPALLRGLTDRAASVRAAARESLDWIAPRRTLELIPHLVAALGDPAPEVQGTAADLLVTPAAATKLVEALGTPFKPVRDLLATALVRLGDDAAGELVRALTNRDLRTVAAQVLGQFAKLDDKNRKELEKLTTSDDPAVRPVATELLKQIAAGGQRGPVVIPEIPIEGWGERGLGAKQLDDAAASAVPTDDLVLGLRDGRPSARANAAGVLARRAKRDESLEDTLCSALSVLVRDHDPEVRRAAIQALADLGTALTIGPLVEAVADHDADLAHAARAQIEKMGPKAAGWLIASLSKQQSGAVHGVVVDLLVEDGKPAVPALVAALEQPSSLGREIAATVLERLGEAGADAVPALVQALSDPNDDVARAAALALGSVATPKESVLVALSEAYRRGAASLRDAASRAIARLSAPVPVPVAPIELDGFEQRLLTAKDIGKGAAKIGLVPLLQALGDGRALVRHNAVVALGTLGAKGVDATGRLAMCLRDPDRGVRSAAVRALGDVAGGDDAPVAARGLADALLDPELAESAAQALATLGASIVPGLVEALDRDAELAAHTVFVALKAQEKLAVEPLARALESPSARVRANAAAALAVISREVAEPARAALGAASKDPDDLVRANARRALEALDGVTAAPKAIAPEPIAIDGFEERELPDKDLEKAVTRVGREVLFAALADGRPVVRRNAAVALGADKTAAARLAVSVRDPDPSVRRAVVQALARAGGEEHAVAAIIEAMIDPDRAVRDAAGQALSSLGKAAIPGLVAALDHDPELAARTVIAHFAPLDRAGVEALVPALEHPSVRVRSNAASALATFGKGVAEAARPALEKALGDGDDLVRVVARRALDALDGVVPPPRAGTPEPMPMEGFDTGALPLAMLKKNLAALELDALKQFVFEGRQPVRENAARAFQLLARKPEDGVGELLIAVKDVDEGVRIAALDSLGALKLDAERVISALAPLLFHRSRGTGDAALAAVVGYGAAAVPPLLAMLGDRPHRAVPTIALVARQMPKELLKPLAARLAKTEPVLVRENVADVLGALGRDAQSVTHVLVESIREDVELTVRVKTIYALANVVTLSDDVRKLLEAVRANDIRFDVQHAVSDALYYLTSRSRR